MLYNLILVLCVIFSYLILRCALEAQRKAFLMGFEAGKSGEPIKVEEKKRKKYAKQEENQETKRLNSILANINAYDGTGIGQKEI